MININNMLYSTKLLINYKLIFFYYYLVGNITLNDLIIDFTLLLYAKNLFQAYLTAK